MPVMNVICFQYSSFGSQNPVFVVHLHLFVFGVLMSMITVALAALIIKSIDNECISLEKTSLITQYIINFMPSNVILNTFLFIMSLF